MPLLEPILSTSAPEPIGPYSQAIRVGPFLFCSGQIPLDPANNQMKNASVEEETKQVLANLRAVLDAAGATWANVAKTTIFMTDLADFSTVNKLYEAAIGTARPARSTVQVVALPRAARVEIECIAFLG
jgi:2-iminobutanoate/2-iminopropanoate deaminase